MLSFRTFVNNVYKSLSSDYVIANNLLEQPTIFDSVVSESEWIRYGNELFSSFSKVKHLAHKTKSIGNETIVSYASESKIIWFVVADNQWKFFVIQDNHQKIMLSYRNGSKISYYDLLKNIIDLSGNCIVSGEPMSSPAKKTWNKIIANKESEFEIFDNKVRLYVDGVPDKLFNSPKYEIIVYRIG
jgi:hypothetical protein